MAAAIVLVRLCLLQASPGACLAGRFSKSSATHATRGQQAGNLVIPVCNRMSGYNSVTVRLSLLWNAPANDLKSCYSLPVFHKSLLRLFSDLPAVLQALAALFLIASCSFLIPVGSSLVLLSRVCLRSFSLSLSLSPSLSLSILDSGLLIVVLGYCRDSDIK